ncbi:MFS transporter [Streptomyces zagrosensis]|uniref:EmrB/QacA subfamily drug resistance transporter n=1 Tax=Streptomyces zagrosensis TaxID=1042984 RepID=A0A7W9QIM0_9ACTN|nr:MFS transporter [Streptomyces zagrosensis]MBB5939897.1 EmrB/QacA subfamily drug resistance transporter [Streptomyces zagrosensis]
MSDDSVEPQRKRDAADRSRVFVLCSGASFLAFLDLSIISIAFPDILNDFPHTTLNNMTWVVSGYAVMLAATLACAGRVADSVGRRAVFLWSLAGFSIASLVCAVAPSVWWLIAARFVQGVAAGGMIPAALGLILATTPREHIPRAVGAWSAVAGFSAVIGPAVGGLLLRAFGWRSVFYINLPLCTALLIGGLLALPRHLRGSGERLPDPVGSAALALGIAGVVSALTEGDAWGWGDARTIGLGVVGIALIVGTVLRSRTHQAPAIDIAVWRSPVYKIANLGLGMLNMTMFAWMLAAPLFAASVWHWSVLETAGALSIGAVSSMVGSLSAGRVTAPAAQVKVAVLGSLLFAGSNAIWASDLFGAEPNFWGGWLPASLLGGGGLGLAITCLSTLAAKTVPPVAFASGLGMTLTVRQVGGAVGVAGLASIMASSAVPESVSSFHHVYAVAMDINILCALIVSVLLLTLRPSATPDVALPGTSAPAPADRHARGEGASG